MFSRNQTGYTQTADTGKKSRTKAKEMKKNEKIE
jgi:hypothetical protein